MTPLEEPLVATFAALNLSAGMLRSLDAVGYETPTPVQATCIPLIASGIDLILQAQTGTGKTAAFAIPVLETLGDNQNVECLILTPTRELAKQVAGEFERLSGERKVPVAAIYGGAAFGPQLRALKDARVVAATPGRLLDHLRNNALSLDKLRVFILDEADEMLSMGFEKELDAIVDFLPKEVQSVLCSATAGEHIQRLAAHFLTNPEYVSLSSDHVAARSVEHYYFVVSGVGLLNELVTLIEAYNPESALIFCNTRADTQLVAQHLERRGYPVDLINGDLPQSDRESALLAVKEGRIRFLVATDVAARGIDISGLPYVINYSMPESSEGYVHRTGRTGRAGQTGVALTLLNPQQIGTYYQLRTIYKLELEERSIPTREELMTLREQRVLDSLLTALDESKTVARYTPYLSVVDRLLAREDARTVIAKLLSAFAGERERDERAVKKALVDAKAKAKKARELQKEREAEERKRQKAEESEAAEPRSSRSDERARPSDAEARADAGAAKPAASGDRPAADTARPARAENPRRRRAASDDAPKTREHATEKTATTRTRSEPAQAGDEDDAPAAAPKSERREGAPSGEPKMDGREPTDTRATDMRADDARADDGRADDEDEGESVFTKLKFSAGKDAFETTEQLEKFVLHLAGLFPEDLGEIVLRDDHCYVSVRRDYAQDVIDALDGVDVEGLTLSVQRTTKRRRRRRATARKSTSSEV